VRELHFAVERASLLAEKDIIDVGDLPPEILERRGLSTARSAPKPAAPVSSAPPLATSDDGGDGDDGVNDLEEADEGRVRRALEEARWRREKAAEILGVSPRTLYRWIKKLGI
jgi:transcriptional regulator of acetoin/glycerol metabolism